MRVFSLIEITNSKITKLRQQALKRDFVSSLVWVNENIQIFIRTSANQNASSEGYMKPLTDGNRLQHSEKFNRLFKCPHGYLVTPLMVKITFKALDSL